jgi:hypothetical protein
MKYRTALRILTIAALFTFVALEAHAGVAPSGPGDPGVPPPGFGRGPTEFFEDFDSYVAGSDMHGQGGWHGWDGSAGAGALVTNAFSHSVPNSVDINGASDLVHEFSGFTSGFWVLTAYTFIPSQSAANSYFIALNTYADFGPYNWSVQVCFNTTSNTVVDDIGADCATGNALPLVYDQWVEVRVEINVSANTQTFFYNGNSLYTDSWTEHISGGGVANIAALDLFANNSTSIFYDDVSLCSDVGCFVPVELMSVSVDD